ncbi:YceD family protein [Roseivivax sp. CAU 1761]
MTAAQGSPGPFRTADLSQARPTAFAVAPDGAARAALAETLGFQALRKLAFSGEIVPRGKQGFRLTGALGATVVQECGVTLEPVTTRIDTEVERLFLPAERISAPEPGSETEMPEDDTVEPLGAVIDPAAVMAEALLLAAPDFPRAPGVEMGEVEARPAGAAPIRAEETKPFAGLAGLRERLAGDGEEPEER